MSQFYDTMQVIANSKFGRKASETEMKAILHHYEYNLRADEDYAVGGAWRHPNGDRERREADMQYQLKHYFHANDIGRYVSEYSQYKELQKKCLSKSDTQKIQDISDGKIKPQSMSEEELSALYARYLQQKLMPQVKKYSLNQKNLDYHRFEHSEHVAMLAVVYARALNEDPLPALIAGTLHDCAKMTDAGEPDHGPRCVSIAGRFLNNYKDFKLKPEAQKNIIGAIEKHTSGKIAPNYISACLWDADRTRLAWRRGYDASYISTTYGKKNSIYVEK